MAIMFSLFALFASSFIVVTALEYCETRSGLVGPSASDDFYASNLVAREAGKLLISPGHLWRIAEESHDVSTNVTLSFYLNEVVKKADVFIRSDKFWGRGDVFESLYVSTGERTGQLNMLIGGKSLVRSMFTSRSE